MALELIKISEFPESLDLKDWFIVGDINGISYKISRANLEAELGISSLLQMGGAIVPTSNPEPTGDYFWIATEDGTYTSFGGTVVPANSIAIISRVGGVFSSSITQIEPQDLSGLATKTEVEEKADHGYVSNPKTLKQVDVSLSQLSVDVLLSKINITTGANLLNRNYIEPETPTEIEKGGKDRLMDGTTGIIVTSAGWYVSPLIEWGNNSQITASGYRGWAQYKEDGVTPTSVNLPASIPSGGVTIDKDADARFLRIAVLTAAGNTMVNYGSTVKPFEVYEESVNSRAYGNTPLFFYGSLKEMLLSESYYPVSPTYTDGVINSPVSVIYPDGAVGQLTLTRENELVTKIVATKVLNDITLTTTMNITRDLDGNATNITFN